MSHDYESFRSRRGQTSKFEFAISKDHAVSDPKYKLPSTGRVAGQPITTPAPVAASAKSLSGGAKSTIGTVSADGRQLGRVPVHSRYRHFMEQQEMFLNLRHLPPWKMLSRDVKLYQATKLMAVLGLGVAFWNFSSLVLKKN